MDANPSTGQAISSRTKVAAGKITWIGVMLNPDAQRVRGASPRKRKAGRWIRRSPRPGHYHPRISLTRDTGRLGLVQSEDQTVAWRAPLCCMSFRTAMGGSKTKG